MAWYMTSARKEKWNAASLLLAHHPLAISHCASQIAAMRIAVSHRKPKSQETCHAVSPNRTQRSFKSPHRRNSSKWSQIAKKNGPKKHTDFIIFQKTAVKMKTKSGLGKVRGTKSHFTDPCKNHIKACRKASKSFFTFLDSFHQITVKSKQICNKNTHLRNALCKIEIKNPLLFVGMQDAARRDCAHWGRK